MRLWWKNTKQKIRDISNYVFIIDDLRIYEDNNYEHGNWSDRKIYGGDGIDFIYNLFGYLITYLIIHIHAF